MSGSIVQRVVLRHLVAAQEDPQVRLSTLLKQARTELQKYKAWSQGFTAALKRAQKGAQGLPVELVWQDEFRDFWEPFWPIENRLLNALEEMENLGASYKDLAKLTKEAGPYLDPPRGARIEDAISNPKFHDHPRLGRSQIAYPKEDLEQWFGKFSTWVDTALRGLSKIIDKAA